MVFGQKRAATSDSQGEVLNKKERMHCHVTHNMSLSLVAVRHCSADCVNISQSTSEDVTKTPGLTFAGSEVRQVLPKLAFRTSRFYAIVFAEYVVLLNLVLGMRILKCSSKS